MTGLADHLRRLIELQGPLSLARFMTEAMWHPTAGYYARSAVLGAAGDYVTAPEVSQMFGELIGLWCASVWHQMGRPGRVLLVELGPGRGTLMADLLRATRVAAGFDDAIELHLIEADARFRDLQRTTLGRRDAVWHEQFGALPDGPVILVTNEFFDALPIVQLERFEGGWYERLVDVDAAGSGFHFVRAMNPSPAAALIPPELSRSPAGSLVEIAPMALTLAGSIGARLAAEGGAALIIDYGPAESRLGPTLQALRRHARHDPLSDPGGADLTAHVDFASLARAASDAGARTFGPEPQGLLLERLGIRMRADRLLETATRGQAALIKSALRRLIDPAEMGTLFKALAIAGPAISSLAGFGSVR